jgi:hypothetical protein
VIPAEAIEAAAIVLWDKEMNATWSSVADGFKVRFTRDARHALEAAAPHMLAAAWDEGRDVAHEEMARMYASQCEGDDCDCNEPRVNPYRRDAA